MNGSLETLTEGEYIQKFERQKNLFKGDLLTLGYLGFVVLTETAITSYTLYNFITTKDINYVGPSSLVLVALGFSYLLFRECFKETKKGYREMQEVKQQLNNYSSFSSDNKSF